MSVEFQVTLNDEEENAAAEAKRRKAYGKGFHDALRALGVDPEQYMSITKLQRAEQALSGIEAKVFECVPIEQAWNRHSIMGEMRRRTGTNSDPHIVDGCLVDLLQRGLIKEPQAGLFKRSQARVHQFTQGAMASAMQAAMAPPKPPAAPSPPPPPPAPARPGAKREFTGDPLEVLDLTAQLQELMNDFEAWAVKAAERMEKHADAKPEELLQMALSMLNKKA